MSRQPILLPVAQKVRHEELTPLVTPAGLFACDFYVDGIERGQEVPGGYERWGIVSIDHHAPMPRMSREICSTTLALRQIAERGRPPAEAAVVINHTDCDSVLSAALLLGLLEPHERYGAAAVAADHTGEADDLADLLQGLDPRRDFASSLDAVRRLESGQSLPEEALQGLEERRRRREEARAAVGSGVFRLLGRLAFAELPGRTDGELFPALLPEAALILVFVPRHGNAGGQSWDAKLRLGRAAPAGASLRDISIRGFDPHYDGRWNAGSNKRGGGTGLGLETYAEQLAAAARQAWGGAW